MRKKGGYFFLVFLGIAVTIVCSSLCYGTDSVQYLFNILYYVIWRLHPSKTLPFSQLEKEKANLVCHF